MNGGIAPVILNLGYVRGEWLALRLRRFTAGKEFLYSLKRGWGGTQSRSGRFREGVNFLPPPGIEARFLCYRVRSD